MNGAAETRRFLAVDAMRGLTIAGMILVNMAISPRYSWATLLHSVWNGFTLADSIYPSFLFVVGTAIALTFERPGTPPPGWDRILRRVALLIACGVFVSNFPFGRFDAGNDWQWQALAALRLPGVLQRIGIAYLIAALVVKSGGARAGLAYVLAMLPLNWWLALHFGDLTLQGSAALKVDSASFGLSHLYTGEGRPFDPEGLLGTFPAAANMLAGYLVLRTIRLSQGSAATLRNLALLGLALVVLALIWNQVLPFNKKLWSSSFVLLNIGLDTALLAMLVWLIDLKGWRAGTGVLSVFGKNPLALYILAEVLMAIAWTIPVGRELAFMWLFKHVFGGAVIGKAGSFLFGLALLALCWLAGWWLDRRKIYIRL